MDETGRLKEFIEQVGKGGNEVNRKNKRIKPLGIIIILLLLTAVTAASLLFAAYLKNSYEVKNTFKPADSIIPEIVETFEENDYKLKEDVSFKVGTTEYPVYVRAAIVITWQDKNGIVYFSKPVPPVDEDGNENENPDYSILLNLDDWTLGEDGFYYCNSIIYPPDPPVEGGGETPILIKECKQVLPAPADGYTLSVEIIVQTIQAVGYTDGEDNTDDENTTGKIPAWDDATWQVVDE